jgi:glycine dehydrogenase
VREYREEFRQRHIGPSESEISEMLKSIGQESLSTLLDAIIPSAIRDQIKLSEKLPPSINEVDALAELKAIASKNLLFKNYIGMGYYGNIIPPVVARNILENPAWYTAYTPYQPEISQGRLEALYIFQTIITELTALDIANASMLDEGTAGAEAVGMAVRSYKGENLLVGLDSGLHPQTIEVIKVRLTALNIDFEMVNSLEPAEIADKKYAALVVSQFSTLGKRRSDELIKKLSEVQKNADGFLILACDLLALMINTAPGNLGADLAFGTSQRFGVPVGFGGPAAGFLAARAGLERTLPGRLVGKSLDRHQNSAFRLALQTREQHIRREKATSNICTAQVLLAVLSAFYAIWHGKSGLEKIANRVHGVAVGFAQLLKSNGFEVGAGDFFDTITIANLNIAKIKEVAEKAKINLRYQGGVVAIAFDETTSPSDLIALAEVFAINLSSSESDLIFQNMVNHKRPDKFMSQAIFHQEFTETKMLRYIRSLSDKDLALDRTMIPLGSCTMKLNATSEMIPVTWPEFSNIHPFAPKNQWNGYSEMISQLSNWLTQITGYDVVSLAPNAGSQGEFAGLLAIRQYQIANNHLERDICLIPSSAHGTNAASAAMAGMKVVVVACDENGNVSLDDLKAKISEHAGKIAALMITYPSTHGVFEEEVKEICAVIHDAGGQVYLDGANLNALVGLASPGKFGADVSHLNLHKTFAIPHGGGGPGVGPVIARSHLGPYLPKVETRGEIGELSESFGENSLGPVTSAPYGSASVLPISWMYIRMLGGEGLELATSVAILNANYMAKELNPYFPVLYTGRNNLVAHECILDFREITKNTGVSVDDVAKRLMDFGFHAPTMSFPVSGTLMIEPTESEDKGELDRFISAMKTIAAEIDEIATGKIALAESPLHFAPHTQEDLLQADWDRKYDRAVGAFPTGLAIRNEELSTKELNRRNKFWPSVGRIDGAYGDRNLICSCPPVDSYQ